MGQPKARDNRKPWPPERVRALRVKCGITAREAARWVGVSLRTWQRWEQPEDSPSYRPPCGPARVQLDRMANRAAMKPWPKEETQQEARRQAGKAGNVESYQDDSGNAPDAI